MTPGLFLLVLLGGGIGASLRFIVDGLIMRRVRGGFPWGMFVINGTGSLLLGFFTGLAASSALAADWLAVLGSGVMGGYTTFGTVMVDTVHMLHRRAFGWAAVNGLAMLVLTVLLALSGHAIGRSL